MLEDAIYEFTIQLSDVRYYNKDSSYGIIMFYTSDKIPHTEKSLIDERYVGCIVGQMQELDYGIDYKVKAKIVKHKTYGYQYQVINICSEMPKSLEQQKKFLESLVTKKQADALLSAYPNVVEMVMNNQEVDLNKVYGIKDKTFKLIKDKILDCYVIQDILILLQPLGVTFNAIKKLADSETNPILLKKKILENPYILTKIHGFGFKRVDGIALKLKPELRVSQERTEAYLKYVLKEIGNSEGHTWITRKKLETFIRKDILECYDIYKEFIITEETNSYLLHIEDNKIGLNEYFRIAVDIKERIDYLSNLDSIIQPLTEEEIEYSILETENELGFKLTDEQKNAIKSVNDNNITIITGSAGSGKSSVIRGIINLLKRTSIRKDYKKSYFNQQSENPMEREIHTFDEIYNSQISIGQCALSAKAAKRIKEVTNENATTMHRMLEFSGDGFARGKDFPLNHHVNIIDEVSMVNDSLMRSYLNAIKPHSKVIIVFDFAQLPAIGAGDFARDILMASDLNIHRFTKVHRQGELSGILADANKVRKGINPIQQLKPKVLHGELQDMFYYFSNDRSKLNKMAITTYLKAIETLGTDEVTIITPRKKDCTNSADEINKTIQDYLIKDDKPFFERWKDGKQMKFKLGSKVMQKVNNYSPDKNVINGDEGYLTSIDNDGKKFIVTFDLENGKKEVEYTFNEANEIELSYAVSIHSAQGSQWNTVICVFDMNSYIMLNRKILYTAITRSSKRCLLCAEPKAFKGCIDDQNNQPRNTYLGDIINLNSINKNIK